MVRAFPDTWWSLNVVGDTVHRFAFDIEKQVVTAALLSNYSFGVEDEWREYGAPVSAETAEGLGLSVDEAFVFVQVIYPVRILQLNRDAGKKLDRAKDVMVAMVDDLDALHGEEAKRVVRLFLAAYADARPGSLARFVDAATASRYIRLREAVKCWEAGVPLPVAMATLSRPDHDASTVVELLASGVPHDYAEALVAEGAKLEQAVELWQDGIALEYARELV